MKIIKPCFGVESVPGVRGKKSIGLDRNGFSIVEVMIGIAIFSIGVLAVANMQISAMQGNTSARQYTEASTWGMDKIETLMMLPYNHSDLNDTDGDGGAGDRGLFDVTAASADHIENDPSGQYTLYWNVAVDDLIERTKTVSVIIIWRGNGMQRSVSMQRVVPEII
ncbi:MAG: prepilin-type N-terminal cleavage/methylation domain-containing protein [Desulfobacterales bacterium]|jgi:type IV pilus assembly protein PilV|nr:prepilin-type N-terminal cleavage/methylation domain-containing protein [Desulfobacterales bacterium]